MVHIGCLLALLHRFSKSGSRSSRLHGLMLVSLVHLHECFSSVSSEVPSTIARVTVEWGLEDHVAWCNIVMKAHGDVSGEYSMLRACLYFWVWGWLFEVQHLGIRIPWIKVWHEHSNKLQKFSPSGVLATNTNSNFTFCQVFLIGVTG